MLETQGDLFMHIDNFLPQYEFNELHSILIQAPPDKIFTAIKELTQADLSPLIFLMLSIRQLPAKLLGKGISRNFNNETFLEQLYEGGFIPLAEEINREIVFGLIGQFWSLTGTDDSPSIPDPKAYLEFDHPDYAKVAANFLIQQNAENAHYRCTTETRIHVPDIKTRRKFALYWRLISMGSGWIRMMWLRAIKRKALAL